MLATYKSRKIAFEIQLATTQLPVIDAREYFYEGRNYGLLWLTWNLNPNEDRPLLTSFEDIFYSHNKNIFSLDDEVISRSLKENNFCLRVYWQAEDQWQSKVVYLDALTWPESGRPYAVEPPPSWNMQFRARWLSATSEAGISGLASRELFEELANNLALGEAERDCLETDYIADLICCILSFVENRPVGTRQRNLTEFMNTFLLSPRRHRYARLLRKVISATVGNEFLTRQSIRVKFEQAFEQPQDGPNSVSGRIALRLFPELFETSRKAVLVRQ
ncbi:MAG: hypothetical protein HC850_10310 [Rhodomicrobium sp.]|nr:hypothetical protein [Rhodomicrobium sp.]